MVGTYFSDWIRQKVIDVVGEELFLTGGLKITTTLDYDLQQVAERSVARGLKEIDKRQGFQGPLLKFKNERESEKFIKNHRQQLLQKHSHFFYLNQDGSISYEFGFDETEYESQTLKALGQKKYLEPYALAPGASPGIVDRFLNTQDEYQAVVTLVNDDLQMIFVDVAGVKGVIPFDYFKWAHPRKIQSNRSFNVEQNIPSKIVKKNDVVLVSFIKGPVPIYPHLTDIVKKKIKEKNLIQILKNQLYFVFQLDQTPEVEGALVSIEPETGHVLSLVGGHRFERSQFNRALQSRRQPGSSFKSLLFALALEEGFTPADILIDSPEALVGVDENISWRPKNYDGQFIGPVTLRTALEQSRNVPTIKMVADIGVKKVIQFCERIGLKNTKFDQDLSISLGAFGVSLFDLVTAYSIFPNYGKKLSIKTILSVTDRFGKSYSVKDFDKEFQAHHYENVKSSEKSLQETQENQDLELQVHGGIEKKVNPYHSQLYGDIVYDPRLSFIMTNLLKGVIQDDDGTAASARDLGPYFAGKTGTTNDYVDAWFIGFSTKVLTGVWTGFDHNGSMGYGETGGRAALPIWKEFMRETIPRYKLSDFLTPDGIVKVLIDKNTGKLTTSENPEAFMESFVVGTEPGRTLDGQNESSTSELNHLIEEDEYFKNQ
jgi:penicillin-binding protein 1A